MMESRIHIRVQAVISVVDDFTGRPVETGLVRMEMPGGTRVIQKPGGCFAVIDYPSRKMEFDISSPIYETAHVKADMDAFDEACPMICIRLVPGHCYPMPEGITSIEGRINPGETVLAVCVEQAHPMRLLYDYDKKKDGQSIRIYHMPGEMLEGRRLALVSEGKLLEYMEISKKENEEGLYRLKSPLSKNYKKTGIHICRINRGKAAGNGFFRIPLAEVPAEGCECLCMPESESGAVMWSGRIRCGVRNVMERNCTG